MKKRILLVDDDPALRKALCTLLNRAGYQTEPAADGREAMRLHSLSPADLVITDIIMPDGDGLETLLELRRRADCPPVIAISGGGRLQPQNYLNIALRLGAVAVLEKPFSHEELLALTARALESPAPQAWPATCNCARG
jgi:DNA-binding response OmpR family regulator